MKFDKPIIISLETSGTTCGVALSSADEIICEYSIFGRNLHDRLLTENIRRVLLDTGLDFEQVDAVAVSSGPGSFTGLRIGASAAKGICFENKPKLIAVPTLSAIAKAAIHYAGKGACKEITPVIHAHKNMFYYQKFTPDGNVKSDIFQIEHGELRQEISSDSLVCGPGAGKAGYDVAFPILNVLSAKFISGMAACLFEKGEFVSSESFVPLYIQEFEPKTKRKKIL